MANSKRKPIEGTKRSPGKSKFSFPKKEDPKVDGSYLDRLFAEYEKQSKDQENQDTPAGIKKAEEVDQPFAIKRDQGGEIHQSTTLMSTAGATSQQVSPTTPVQVSEKEPPDTEINQSAAQHEIPAAAGSLIPSLKQEPTPSIQKGPKGIQLPVISSDDTDLLGNLKKKYRLAKGEIKVLKTLLVMCRRDGVDYCYIKIPQLMLDANLKERQTQLVLRNLCELGLVEKLAEYSNADRLGTKYRIITDLL